MEALKCVKIISWKYFLGSNFISKFPMLCISQTWRDIFRINKNIQKRLSRHIYLLSSSLREQPVFSGSCFTRGETRAGNYVTQAQVLSWSAIYLYIYIWRIASVVMPKGFEKDIILSLTRAVSVGTFLPTGGRDSEFGTLLLLYITAPA